MYGGLRVALGLKLSLHSPLVTKRNRIDDDDQGAEDQTGGLAEPVEIEAQKDGISERWRQGNTLPAAIHETRMRSRWQG